MKLPAHLLTMAPGLVVAPDPATAGCTIIDSHDGDRTCAQVGVTSAVGWSETASDRTDDSTEPGLLLPKVHADWHTPVERGPVPARPLRRSAVGSTSNSRRFKYLSIRRGVTSWSTWTARTA